MAGRAPLAEPIARELVASSARPPPARAPRSAQHTVYSKANTAEKSSRVVALTIDDRERILWALDDVRTDALAELRGVLLQEHEWRQREGLA
jgi:hypothetical protein